MVELDWCPCIDDQTRRDFAQHVVTSISKKYPITEPLTLISLGSGALKQEELIARLLLDAGYTTLTLVLIDILYAQQPLPTLEEIEKQQIIFESLPDFITLGDLYNALENTDNSDTITQLEKQIDALENNMRIKEYVALCDQHITLLHQDRVALLAQSLNAFKPDATIKIQSYQSVHEYLHRDRKNTIIIFVDPDTRKEYAGKQRTDLATLSRLTGHIYQLRHDISTKKIICI